MLTLDYSRMHIAKEFTQTNTLLTTLSNCPDFENLRLASAGPDLLDGDQDDRQVVARLHKLEDLNLFLAIPDTAHSTDRSFSQSHFGSQLRPKDFLSVYSL